MPEIKGFRLLKPFGNYKVNKRYNHFGGLVSGLVNADADKILFADKEWFKPVYVRKKKTERLYTKAEMIQFRNDTEMHSTTPFRLKHGGKGTYQDLEDKWFKLHK